jgi:purine-nucleoside phosphorylase
VDERLALGDIVLALGAGTDANCNRQRFAGYDLPATASWALLQRLASVAQSRHIQLFVGNVFSSDQFYGGAPSLLALLQAQKILAIEMEAAGLYAVAAEHGVEAAALLTVTDHLPSGAGWPSERREQDLLPMLGLALDALLEC